MHEADDRQAPLEPLEKCVLRLIGRSSAHGVFSKRCRPISRSGSCCRRRTRRAGSGEVGGRRALPDAAGRIVLRAVAGAEPAVIVALMGERDAAEMRADADHHQPLVVALLDARLIGLRIGQAVDRDRARLVDLLLGAVADEDRLAAPEHLDDLPLGDRREIDLDRRAGRDGRGVGIHLGDQRHQGGRGADRAHGAGGDVEKIAARRLGRRHRRHARGSFLLRRSARAANPFGAP